MIIEFYYEEYYNVNQSPKILSVINEILKRASFLTDDVIKIVTICNIKNNVLISNDVYIGLCKYCPFNIKKINNILINDYDCHLKKYTNRDQPPEIENNDLQNIIKMIYSHIDIINIINTIDDIFKE